jgi:hypothetical protein
MPPSFGVWEKNFFLSASAVLLRKKDVAEGVAF